MKKRKRRNNSNSLKPFIILLFIIIIACSTWLIIKNGSKSDNTNIENESEVKETATHEEEEQPKEEEQKVSKLNDLAEDEASFGKLEEPVYKINEKNIKVPVLIYHGFSTPMLSNEDDPYKLMCSTDLFEDQITTLKDAGYTFITLEDMYKYKNGKIGLPEKNITITMDDGWEGNYTEAFDVIKKYNVPATIFIVEELVGTSGYFDWDQAKEMYDSGLVKIHVHGRKHSSATGYNSKDKLIEDYNHTHSMIEEKLGAKIQKIMAYPAGDSSADTIKWLKEAGFEVQVQTKYGTVNKSNSLDLTGLGRIRAEKASGASILKTINSK
ncbi:MAG: polysaccharide deacetylase family protein [Clostridia bacterium]|nr:polysaccharide deacetylase family protein [Clostridia bacterium]